MDAPDAADERSAACEVTVTRVVAERKGERLVMGCCAVVVLWWWWGGGVVHVSFRMVWLPEGSVGSG